MAGSTERLTAAREASARRDWPACFRELTLVRAEGTALGPDDLVILADAAWWLGRIRDVLQICEECYRRYLDDDRPDRAATVALETAFHWFLRGQPDVGAGWLSRARRLLTTLPDRTAGHAFLLMMEANGLAAEGEADAAIQTAYRLHELGRELGDSGFCASALAIEGTVRIRRGDVERGYELLNEALLPALAGQIDPAVAGNLYCQMMAICHDLADTARARHWTAVTRQWCDDLSSAVMFIGICRVHRTQLLRLEGRWDRALREATAATEDLAELNVEAVAEAYYEIGETHRLRGYPGPARDAYDQAERRGRISQPGRALLLLAEGSSAQAQTEIGRALAEESNPFRRARMLVAQVEIACSRADDTTADAAAAELAEIAATYRSAGFRTWAAMAQGAVSLNRGRADEALDPLRTAVEGCHQLGAVLEHATARALLADALDACGHPQTARAERDAAVETFHSLGAEPRLVWLTRRRDQLPGGLTARETEILAAVATGLPNRQVAARLVISEKTVARHLANVYAKLGVSTRTEAAAWAHAHGVEAADPWLHRSV